MERPEIEVGGVHRVTVCARIGKIDRMENYAALGLLCLEETIFGRPIMAISYSTS